MQILKNKKLACAAILLVLLTATGIAYAAYTFFTVKSEITIDEVIVLSFMDPVNDLKPYMVDGSPLPAITVTPEGYGASITIKAGAEDASEFCPGEALVIPLNVRNRVNVAVPLTVSISGTPGLNWYWAFETNTAGSSDFKPSGWVGTWPATFDVATRGNFGSAMKDATVFFVYIGVPMDAAPGTYTVWVSFSRG